MSIRMKTKSKSVGAQTPSTTMVVNSAVISRTSISISVNLVASISQLWRNNGGDLDGGGGRIKSKEARAGAWTSAFRSN